MIEPKTTIFTGTAQIHDEFSYSPENFFNIDYKITVVDDCLGNLTVTADLLNVPGQDDYTITDGDITVHSKTLIGQFYLFVNEEVYTVEFPDLSNRGNHSITAYISDGGSCGIISSIGVCLNLEMDTPLWDYSMSAGHFERNFNYTCKYVNPYIKTFNEIYRNISNYVELNGAIKFKGDLSLGAYQSSFDTSFLTIEILVNNELKASKIQPCSDSYEFSCTLNLSQIEGLKYGDAVTVKATPVSTTPSGKQLVGSSASNTLVIIAPKVFRTNPMFAKNDGSNFNRELVHMKNSEGKWVICNPTALKQQ